MIHRIVVAVASLVALAVGRSVVPVASGPAHPVQAKKFVAVVDASGRPITDLSATDFRVRVDGQQLQTLSAEPADEPLSLVFVFGGAPVSATQSVRAVLRTLIADLRHDTGTTLGLMLDPGPPTPALWNVGDERLESSVSKYVSTVDLAPVDESIIVAAHALATANSSRRAIVVLSLYPDNQNAPRSVPSSAVLAALRESEASLWTLDIGSTDTRSDRSMEKIYTDGAKFSGGLAMKIDSARVADQVRRITQILRSQYAVVFESPSAIPPDSTVGLEVRGQPRTVLSSAWPPNSGYRP